MEFHSHPFTPAACHVGPDQDAEIPLPLGSGQFDCKRELELLRGLIKPCPVPLLVAERLFEESFCVGGRDFV